MFTAGVDLASQDGKTASCVIEWSNGQASVEEISLGVNDGSIIDLILSVEKFGIDIPLGWPIAFSDALRRHTDLESWPRSYDHANNEAFRLRRTDRWVWRTLRTRPPLSVSTDQISIPAMRAASFLARLPDPPARDGSGVVVEVYPAAALLRWGLPSVGYKGKEKSDVRRELVERLVREVAPWLTWRSDEIDLCLGSDDAFDAVVAALVARAASVGLVEPIPGEDHSAAMSEGWIAIPLEGSLTQLPRA